MKGDEKKAPRLPKNGKWEVEVDFERRVVHSGENDWQVRDDFPRCMRSRAAGHDNHCHYHFYFDGVGWVDGIYLGLTEGQVTCAGNGQCPL